MDLQNRHWYVLAKLWLLGEDLEGTEYMDDRGDDGLQISVVKTIKGVCKLLQQAAKIFWSRMVIPWAAVVPFMQ